MPNAFLRWSHAADLRFDETTLPGDIAFQVSNAPVGFGLADPNNPFVQANVAAMRTMFGPQQAAPTPIGAGGQPQPVNIPGLDIERLKGELAALQRATPNFRGEIFSKIEPLKAFGYTSYPTPAARLARIDAIKEQLVATGAMQPPKPSLAEKYVFAPLDRFIYRPIVSDPLGYVGNYTGATIEQHKKDPLWRQILAGPEGFFGGVSNVLTLQHTGPVQEFEEGLAPGQQESATQRFAREEINQASPGQAFALAARQYGSQIAPGANETYNLWMDQMGLDALMLGGRHVRDFSQGRILAATANGEEISQLLEANGDHGFKWQSGVTDAVIRFTGDPTILIGKTGNAFRTLALQRPVIGVGQARAYVESKGFNNFLSWAEGKSYDQLMANKALSKATHGPALAALFSSRLSKDELKLATRAAYGDPEAFAELATLRYDIALRMGRFESHRIDDLYDTITVSPTNLGEALRRFDAQDQLDEIIKEVRATGRYDDELSRQQVKAGAESIRAEERARIELLELADYKQGFSGTLTGIARPSGPTRGMGSRIRFGLTRQEFFQDSIYGKPIKFTRDLFRYRPGFNVDLNRPTGINDISRMLDKAGVGGESRQKVLDRYARASNPGTRMYAAEAADKAVFEHIGGKYGLDASSTEELYHQYAARKSKLHAMVRNKIYAGQKAGETNPVMLIDEDGVTHSWPVTDSQLADSWSLPDVDLIERAVKENAASIASIRGLGYSAKDTITMVGDSLNRLWKLSALFRVGYPVRALSDPQLRAMAMMGGMTWLGKQRKQAYNAFMRGSTSKQVKKAMLDAENEHAMLGAIQTRYPKPGFEEPMINGRKMPSDYGQWDDPNQFYRVADQAGQFSRFVAGETQVFLDDLRSKVGDWRSLTPSDPEFFPEWASVVHNQLGNSKIIHRILRYGEDDAVDWLKTHPAGQAIRRQLPWWETEDELILRNSYLIDQYLPTEELRAMVRDGQVISGKHLQETVPTELWPAVHAQMAKWVAHEGGLSSAINGITDTFYKIVNRIPEKQMFAHPVHNALYQGRLKQLVEQHGDVDLPWEVIDGYARQAREFALKEMKRIVYDVTRQPNVAFAIRWASPFFAAYYDSMRAWAGLIWDDMAIPGRAHLLWDAPNKGGLMVDQHGDKLAPGTSDPDAVMVLPILESMREGFEKTFGIGPDLRFRKQSFAVMLSSGDYWYLPGSGPGVSIPVNEIAKRKPTVEDDNAFLRWVLPFGTEQSTWDVLLPITPNRIRQALQGVDNQDFANSWATIYNTEFTKFRQGRRKDAPTIEEVTDRARNLAFLRLATNFLSPAGVQYTSPYQFYIDQYRRIQDTADTPYNAQQTFLNLYGDEFEAFTKYMSRNKTGIRSSTQAVASAQRYKDIIAEVPELGWLVLGPENQGKYASSARNWLFSTPIVPGGSEKYRTIMTPEEYAKALKADEGWEKYTAVLNAVESERIARGLKTIYEKGGEDLVDLKRQVTLNLTEQNSAWAEEFGKRDDTYIRRLLPYLAKVSTDPRLQDRSDLMVLGQYLQLRDAIVNELRLRASSGMARTTESTEDNSDLAALWQQARAQYVEKNTLFGDIYNRLLDRDEVISADDPYAFGEQQ